MTDIKDLPKFYSHLLDENVALEAKIDAIKEIMREHRDDWAPEHPPYALMDCLERMEEVLDVSYPPK